MVPESLRERESCWSFQIARGPETARLTQERTTGSLIPAILKSTSPMRRSPWEEVEVKGLTPVAEAPRQTEAAECSLPALTSTDFTSPLATVAANSATIWVWGVMG